MANEKDSIYSVQELVSEAKALFGVRPECVTAAFKMAGRKEAALSEARELVAAFMRKTNY